MKLVLLGADGQVGWELRRALAPLGTIVTAGRRADIEIDLGAETGLTQALESARPDVIVNAAAYTAVDGAESDAEAAHAVNARAPAQMAEAAKAIGACLVHYSTDYVFDGSGDRPWTELDTPAPLNVYGATKLEGETAVRESGCRHLILRTSWVYSTRRSNFVRTVLRLASKQEGPRIVDDQFGAPTGAELIADATAHILRRVAAETDGFGTYHLSAAGKTSWYGYARFVVECALRHDWPLEVSPDCIEPVSSEAFPTAARRPRNCLLDCSALADRFGIVLPDWRGGVERVVEELYRSRETESE